MCLTSLKQDFLCVSESSLLWASQNTSRWALVSTCFSFFMSRRLVQCVTNQLINQSIYLTDKWLTPYFSPLLLFSHPHYWKSIFTYMCFIITKNKAQCVKQHVPLWHTHFESALLLLLSHALIPHILFLFGTNRRVRNRESTRVKLEVWREHEVLPLYLTRGRQHIESQGLKKDRLNIYVLHQMVWSSSSPIISASLFVDSYCDLVLISTSQLVPN